jgi:hypothetical protein
VNRKSIFPAGIQSPDLQTVPTRYNARVCVCVCGRVFVYVRTHMFVVLVTEQHISFNTEFRYWLYFDTAAHFRN